MRRRSIFAKTLRDLRWQVAGFGLALALIAALDVLIWPSYKDSLQNLELPPALEAFLGDELSIGTPAGYLAAEFFSWVPVLLVVYGVINGTGAIAAEEGAGTLDLLLAQPVTRRDVVVEKAAAGALGAVGIVAIGLLGFLATVPPVAIDIALSDIAVACANLIPITLLFYALSFWLGVAAPNRGVAVAVVVAFATASYFLDLVTNAVDALSWLEYVTPFYYYGGGLPLVEGMVWWHVGSLLGAAALLLVIATRAFEQRDIAAGGHEVDLLRLLRLSAAGERVSRAPAE